MHDMHDRKTTSSPSCSLMRSTHPRKCPQNIRTNDIHAPVQMAHPDTAYSKHPDTACSHTRIHPIADSRKQPVSESRTQPVPTLEHSRCSLPNTGRARSQIRAAPAVKNSPHPLPQAPCIAAETPPRHSAFFHAAPWDKSRRKHIDTIRKKRFTVCPRLAKSPYLLD